MIDDRRLQTYLRTLPDHEAVAVKRRLDRLREDCGCHVGSIVMLSVTTIWIVYASFAPATGKSGRHIILTGLAVLSVSALIGKLLGLGLARVRLHLTVRNLRHRVVPARERIV